MGILLTIVVAVAIPVTLSLASEGGALKWEPYFSRPDSEIRGAIDTARQKGQVVVVDFTATWCVNCKVLKKTVLDSNAVKAAVTKNGVVLLEADLTSKKTPGWEYLFSLGQTAVPTLAIYGPGLDKPLIYNAYTPEVVVDAIKRANGPVLSSRSTVP